MTESRKLKKPAPPSKANYKKNDGRSPTKPASPAPDIDAETAKLEATEYCLFHYPTLYTAGTPCLSAIRQRAFWLVPIVLATPSNGVLGQVGELRLDARTGKIIEATDRSEVIAKGTQLFQRKGNGPAATVPRPTPANRTARVSKEIRSRPA